MTGIRSLLLGLGLGSEHTSAHQASNGRAENKRFQAHDRFSHFARAMRISHRRLLLPSGGFRRR